MPHQFIRYWQLHYIPILLSIGSLIFYAVFAYNLEREDFFKLLALFVALFFFSIKLIQFEKWNFKFLWVIGILFRLVFLFAEPNLSQDFYRFIWDGELIKNGINPYSFTPDELIVSEGFAIPNAHELHQSMGSLSAKHYSNYPPLSQVVFACVTLLGGSTIIGSIICMRLTLVLADIGILYFARKLLRNLNRSNHMAFWYFLNPLVIIELTGNLHFEGLMLFFFVWAIYLISKHQRKWAAPLYACAIMLKLVPLLFLPFFVKHFGFKKSIVFYLLVAISCVALLLPFYSTSFFDNYAETVGLWFSNFEFNAGPYNLVKKIAVSHFEAKPWVLIKAYGGLVPKLILIAALLLTFLRKNQNLNTLIVSMLFLLTFYYLLSTTVHPWYTIFLLLLVLFTDYRFALLWSAVVILSYSAYANPGFDENLWWIGLEYFAVFAALIYEFLKFKGYNLIFLKNLLPK
ncbi:MAG: polyprenol phosphomannose-dependent alpha 1,6 mannosyltransferase MptB [Bacteroidota bacterium]